MGSRVRWLLVAAIATSFAVGFTACGGGGGGGGKKKKPTIVSVTPGNGPLAGGTTITIVTSKFKDDFTVLLPSVTVGGVAATGEAATSATTVTAVTPAGVAAGAVDVVVTSQGGQTARETGGFSYDAPPPGCTITSVSPPSGTDAGGNTVILFGSNFELDPGTTVTFGGVAATNVNVVNATQISCTAPAFPGGGVVDVVVTASMTNCTAVGAYTYIVNPTCQVSSVVPGNGPLSGGTNVSISGTGFEMNSTVRFDGVLGTNIVFVTPTLITCNTPADPSGIPAGDYDVDVTVSTPGGAQCVLAAGFHYDLAQVDCTITNVAPVNGPQGGGTVVTIDGTNFRPSATLPTVTFGGIAAAVNPTSTDTQIVCTTPAAPAAGVVDIVIVNSTGGMCSQLAAFTYDPPVGNPCTIASIVPNNGDVGGGTMVTITGTLFDPAGTGVFFDGVAASNVFVNGAGDTITCNAPAGASIGFVDVQVVPMTGTDCTEVGGYEYTGCTFTVTPNFGPIAGGNTVTLNGVGFEVGAAEVFFDTDQATAYFTRDATQIICTVPPSSSGGQQTVDVTVNNPGLGTQCVIPGGYTYTGCEITDVQPQSDDKIGGVLVTITGSNFDTGGADVLFGNNLASNVVVDPTGNSITCNAPPSIIDGPVDIEIRNFNGRNCLSPIQFTYNTPVAPIDPTVTNVNPAQGPIAGGTAVTITGSNFDTNGASVLFGPRAALNVVVVSATQIDCTTPMAAVQGSVNVSVVNLNGGDGTCAGCYEFQPPVVCNPCTLISITPDPAVTPIPVGGEATARVYDGMEFCSASEPWFTQFDPMMNPVTVIGTVQSFTATTLDVLAPPAPVGAGQVLLQVNNSGSLCGSILGMYQ